MPSENRIDPRKNFAPRILPWLLAAAMFVVYFITLNRWVSFASLPYVTRISGWWQPELTNPLLYLVTYPFRWLSPAQIPLALNLFSAACAAISLGLLARCVAILPHDRTEAQRKREKNDFAFLTIWSAWLPPLLAVVVCGLQFTFWQHATNFTGEIFDLLLLAFLAWLLLEYRLDEREGRLYLASFVYGASMAENWAMVGFFPVFIAVIIWLRGLNFFQWQFLKRMLLCGMVGMIFYFLLPVVTAATGDVQLTFWQALKFNLAPQWTVIKNYFTFIFHPHSSAEFLALLLAYLLPVFVMALRWRASFGDASRLGQNLTSILFHLAHGAFLVLLVWMAFDPPFSPRHFSNSVTPLLTFYFLGALSIGYYAGYFLLVFGEKEIVKRPQKNLPALTYVNPAIFSAIWLLAFVAIAGLIYRNVPQIKAANGDMLWHYASAIENKLPKSGGYLMSDDEQRLALVEAALARAGRERNFVPLDTLSLNAPAYHRFLHKKYPAMWPEIVSKTQTNYLNPFGLVQVLMLLSKTNDIYYLHPSYGYYFEAFYAEPHGVAYKLRPLPDETLLPPKADANLIAENESFWAQEAPAFDAIEKAIAPVDPNAPKSFGEKMLETFHIEREQNQNAFIAGIYYSRSADFWGVELQRADELQKAADRFTLATNLNPENLVAEINLDFNAKLRAHKTEPIDLAKTTPDHWGKFNTWTDLININGPFDEPSFCYADGTVLADDNGFLRQSVAQFERVRELAPDDLATRLRLARTYLLAHLPGPALDALQEPLAHPEKFSLAETNETPVNTLAAAAYFEKNENDRAAKLLQHEITEHPNDDELLTIASEVFILHGLFNDALDVINRKLKLSPDDLSALYNRGCVNIQLKKFNEALADLNRVVSALPENYNAVFNRAVANLQAGNLDAAAADYTKLQTLASNSVPVAYGLGEIAWRKHDTNEAVRNYQIYLAGAGTNTDEAKTVVERLRELKK